MIALLMVITMMFTITGCGDEKITSEPAFEDDDFFSETEVEGEVEEESTNSQVNTDSGNKTPSSSGSSSGKNTISGKTWKEVLKGMPSSLRGTTLTVYNWNPMSEYTGAPSVVKKFEKETGIKVKWVAENYETYVTKLAALVAANTAPDVVRTLRPDPIPMKSLQSIDAAGFDFSDSAWDKTLMGAYTYNGKCYATNLANTHIGSVTVLMYNKALINKYDLADPYKLWKENKWTMNKFIEICKAYKKESGADFACGGQDWSNWSIMYGIAGPVGFKNGKFTNDSSDAKLVSITQQIADLYNTDRILAYWKADEFDRGDCLFWSGGAVFARRQNAYFSSLKSAGTLNVVPMPSVDGQKVYYQNMNEYEAFGIAQGAKNAKAAPYFLRYFLDPANYELSSFFCSSQALETYNWCMGQENRMWTTLYSGNAGFYGLPEEGYWDGIKNCAGAQIISFLKSNSPTIQQRVDRYNKAITELK